MPDKADDELDFRSIFDAGKKAEAFRQTQVLEWAEVLSGIRKQIFSDISPYTGALAVFVIHREKLEELESDNRSRFEWHLGEHGWVQWEDGNWYSIPRVSGPYEPCKRPKRGKK